MGKAVASAQSIGLRSSRRGSFFPHGRGPPVQGYSVNSMGSCTCPALDPMHFTPDPTRFALDLSMGSCTPYRGPQLQGMGGGSVHLMWHGISRNSVALLQSLVLTFLGGIKVMGRRMPISSILQRPAAALADTYTHSCSRIRTSPRTQVCALTWRVLAIYPGWRRQSAPYAGWQAQGHARAQTQARTNTAVRSHSRAQALPHANTAVRKHSCAALDIFPRCSPLACFGPSTASWLQPTMLHGAASILF